MYFWQTWANIGLLKACHVLSIAIFCDVSKNRWIFWFISCLWAPWWFFENHLGSKKIRVPVYLYFICFLLNIKFGNKWKKCAFYNSGASWKPLKFTVWLVRAKYINMFGSNWVNECDKKRTYSSNWPKSLSEQTAGSRWQRRPHPWGRWLPCLCRDQRSPSP